MTKPASCEVIDDLTNHLARAMRRGGTPRSMRSLVPRLSSRSLHMRAAGHPAIHPGATRLAEWAETSTQQAQRLCAILRDAGILVAVRHESGGRGRATEYIFDTTMLGRWLVATGANPSSSLLEKLAKWAPTPNQLRLNSDAKRVAQRVTPCHPVALDSNGVLHDETQHAARRSLREGLAAPDRPAIGSLSRRAQGLTRDPNPSALDGGARPSNIVAFPGTAREAKDPAQVARTAQ